MAKNKPGKLQLKAQDPKQVDSAAQQFEALSENDKGIMLRKVGVTYLQSRWRPLIPTPEMRPIINWAGRLSTLVNLMMRLFTNRRLPVEDLSVISEAKIREDVVEPIVKILQAKCHEIEAVLNRNKERSEKANAKNRKQERTAAANEDTPETETALAAESEPEVAAQN